MKIIKGLSLSILLVISLALTLSSCKENEDDHTHMASSAVKENEVAATCTASGNYDEVVYCSVCDIEISRTEKSIDKKQHTAGNWIIDTEATCKKPGTKHKECTACHAELEVGTIDKLTTHTPASAATENYNDSTCETQGSYDEVVYCSVCDIEISRTKKSVNKKTHIPIIDHSVPATETKDGLTEGSHCSICDTVLVAQQIIPATLRGTSVKSSQLTVDGDKIYGSVSNTTTVFSFLNDITVNDNASYVLSTDIGCEATIASKTVNINIGDNTFYILVSNGSEMKLYTVTLRRLPTYTVAFNTNGGTSVESLTVEEGSLISAPITSLAGYALSGWDYDFTQPIMNNVTIQANWTARNDTEYKVEYYLENVKKDGYELFDTATSAGTTDTTASAEIKIFEHFTYTEFAESITSGNINGDGSLVLKVYYTRNVYTVATSVSNSKGGSVTPSSAYPYGTEVVLSASVNLGYTFTGWYNGEANVSDTASYKFTVCENVDLLANIAASTDTKYKVEHYLEYVDKNGYYLYDTYILEGETESGVKAEIKNVEHFTYNATLSNANGNINGDGSLVLKVYYTRNTYVVNSTYILSNSGNETELTAYAYGKEIKLRAPQMIGYSFVGWYEGDNLISQAQAINICVLGNVAYTAKFEVKPEMAIFDFKPFNSECTITSIRNKAITEIVIPDYVTGIGTRAFSGCAELATVIIPGNVKQIESYAFENCTKLTKAAIGSYVKIYDYAFAGCTNLTEVTISNNSFYDRGYIGAYAFENCTKLTKVAIGSYVEIYDYAFAGCTGLTSITLGLLAADSIGRYAFKDCHKLVEVITDPLNSITAGSSAYGYVAYNAMEVHSAESKIVNQSDYLFYTFEGTNYLLGYIGEGTELTLPDSYKGEKYQIYKYAFYGLKDLTSVIIPDSIKSIGECAFYGCNNLEAMTLPFATHILSLFGRNSYSPIDWLKTVIITGGSSIGSYAFSGCTGLTSVIIPDSIKSIGDYAFDGCKSLVYNEYDNACYLGNCDNPYLVLVKAMDESITSCEINANTRFIYSEAFKGCSELANVIMSNSITSIGNNAFSGCANLKGITIPSSVTSIGYDAFYGCLSIEEIRFNSTELGDFSYSNDLFAEMGQNGAGINVIIGKNVSVIPAYLFNNGTKITNVEFEDGSTCERIGSYAFKNCACLTDVTMSDKVKIIENNAFYNCTALESIVMSDNVTSIGNYAFSGCESLSSMIMSAALTDIGNYAFENCTSLSSITIPNVVKSIGDYAFAGCASITDVTVSDSVKSIGTAAFSGCSSLVSITLPFVGGSSMANTPNETTLFGYIFGTTAYSGSVRKSQRYSPEHALYYYFPSGLTSVTITGGDGTDILYGSFFGCDMITSLTIGNKVQAIGENAFSNCRGLTEMTVPDSVESIGAGAFSGCSAIKSITLPFVGSEKKAKHPLGYIFGTSSYTGGIKTSQQYYNGISDPYYYIPQALTSVTITGGTIYSGAFSNCEYLTNVILSEGVKGINTYAFVNCFNLQSISIPNSVTFISESAFEYCVSLQSITVPKSVKSIYINAFQYCFAITDVYFTGTEEEWNNITIGPNNTYLTDAVIHYNS